MSSPKKLNAVASICFQICEGRGRSKVHISAPSEKLVTFLFSCFCQCLPFVAFTHTHIFQLSYRFWGRRKRC